MKFELGFNVESVMLPPRLHLVGISGEPTKFEHAHLFMIRVQKSTLMKHETYFNAEGIKVLICVISSNTFTSKSRGCKG